MVEDNELDSAARSSGLQGFPNLSGRVHVFLHAQPRTIGQRSKCKRLSGIPSDGRGPRFLRGQIPEGGRKKSEFRDRGSKSGRVLVLRQRREAEVYRPLSYLFCSKSTGKNRCDNKTPWVHRSHRSGNWILCKKSVRRNWLPEAIFEPPPAHGIPAR